MAQFEQVKTEYAHGALNGVDYGSKIRVVMRSPTAIVFVGYGLKLITRKDTYRTVTVASDSKRDTVALPDVRALIVKYFGDGADEWLIRAITTRGMGTILVDDGGEALRLPRAEASRLNEAEYESKTPTRDIPVANVKTCVQCGSDLPFAVSTHNLGYSPRDNHPETLEDCQKLTNNQIVSIHGFGREKPKDWWKFISFFHTWDGESYERETFCGDKCAAVYGRRAAAELPLLPTGGEPPKRERPQREYIDHFERETIITEDGFRI